MFSRPTQDLTHFDLFLYNLVCEAVTVASRMKNGVKIDHMFHLIRLKLN